MFVAAIKISHFMIEEIVIKLRFFLIHRHDATGKTSVDNPAFNLVQLSGVQANTDLRCLTVNLTQRTDYGRLRVSDGVVDDANIQLAKQFMTGVIEFVAKLIDG